MTEMMIQLTIPAEVAAEAGLNLSLPFQVSAEPNRLVIQQGGICSACLLDLLKESDDEEEEFE